MKQLRTIVRQSAESINQVSFFYSIFIGCFKRGRKREMKRYGPFGKLAHTHGICSPKKSTVAKKEVFLVFFLTYWEKKEAGRPVVSGFRPQHLESNVKDQRTVYLHFQFSLFPILKKERVRRNDSEWIPNKIDWIFHDKVHFLYFW